MYSPREGRHTLRDSHNRRFWTKPKRPTAVVVAWLIALAFSACNSPAPTASPSQSPLGPNALGADSTAREYVNQLMDRLSVKELQPTTVGVVGTVIAAKQNELRLSITPLVASVNGIVAASSYIPKYEQAGTLVVRVPPEARVPAGTVVADLLGQEVIVVGAAPPRGSMTAEAVLPVGLKATTAGAPSLSTFARRTTSLATGLMVRTMSSVASAPAAVSPAPSTVIERWTDKVGGEWDPPEKEWDVPPQLLGGIAALPGNPCGVSVALRAQFFIGAQASLDYPFVVTLRRLPTGQLGLAAVPQAGNPTFSAKVGLSIGLDLHVAYKCLGINFDMALSGIPIVDPLLVNVITDPPPLQGMTAVPTELHCYQATLGIPRTPIEIGAAICVQVSIEGAPINLTVAGATAANSMIFPASYPLPIEISQLSYAPTKVFTFWVARVIGASKEIAQSKLGPSIDGQLMDVVPPTALMRVTQNLLGGPFRDRKSVV